MSRRNRTSWRPPRLMTIARAYRSALQSQRRRLDEDLDRTEELRPFGSVDRAVVARERQCKSWDDQQVTVYDERPVLDRADGEDRNLRRIEDGDELLDAVHAEIRDRERAIGEIVKLELAVAGPCDEIGTRDRDLLDRLAVGLADDWDDEAGRRCHRDS